MNLAERFWAKVERTEECWFWTAARNRAGYGNFWANGSYVNAHVMAYKLAVGDVPIGMFVLHRCDNPACVRPDHLFIGEPVDNTRDMIQKGRYRNGGALALAARTHCKNGHAFTPENTRWDGSTRRCRACARERRKDWARRNPERVRDYHAGWRQRNAEKVNRYSRAYYARRKAALDRGGLFS